MMKTMFALLLIAGIVLAAQCGPAFAGENGMRTGAAGQDWWQENFGRFLSARSFEGVPWLKHLPGTEAQDRGPALPRFDMLEPFRLHVPDTQVQMTASGQFRTQ